MPEKPKYLVKYTFTRTTVISEVQSSFWGPGDATTSKRWCAKGTCTVKGALLPCISPQLLGLFEWCHLSFMHTTWLQGNAVVLDTKWISDHKLCSSGFVYSNFTFKYCAVGCWFPQQRSWFGCYLSIVHFLETDLPLPQRLQFFLTCGRHHAQKTRDPQVLGKWSLTYYSFC